MIIVTIPYDKTLAGLGWAKEHCASYITNDVHQDGYNTYDKTKIDYFFANEKDALLFKLRWA